MSDSPVPKMQKWPFLIGDVIALIACYVIYNMGGETFETGKAFACVACVVFGAVFAAYPFIQEYRLNARFAEANQLAQVTEFMGKLEKVKNGVTVATAHLETAQDYSEKTIESSREIAERMTDEAKAFAEFMAKANDTEKAHLQLEVDKLKQAEGEWLTTVVTLLDETHRLFRAAADSGNTRVAEQLGKFQLVCRGTASRVGLIAFEAEFGEPFNPEKHNLRDPEAEAPEDARVGKTIAPGYTFQRQPLRPAVVELQGVASPAAEAPQSADNTGPMGTPTTAAPPTEPSTEPELPAETTELTEPTEPADATEPTETEDPEETSGSAETTAGMPDEPEESLTDDTAEIAEEEAAAESFSEEADFIANELAQLEKADEDASSDEENDPKPGQRELL